VLDPEYVLASLMVSEKEPAMPSPSGAERSSGFRPARETE
jgi:hypothetical protein